MIEPWRTAISDADDANIRIRGYDIGALMQRSTFAETIFLLHLGRIPSREEGRLLDAILIACSDHGPGSPSAATARLACSGNTKSLSSAIAAGVLAIGDEHGGAGMACMDTIGSGVNMARSESISIEEAANRVVDLSRSLKVRLAGLGHRVHSKDPRKDVLFSMAHECGVAGDGVAFMLALEESVASKIKPLPINIDGVLAAVLFDLGFPSTFGRLAFIIGRVAGLSAQISEELTREKPMRIRVPVVYDGAPPRDLP